MSILNVNQIQPVGSGQTVTISATNINTGSATFTGGSVGIGTNNPARLLSVMSASGPILELGTYASGANPSIFLHEGTTGSTINGGGLVYDAVNNLLNIVCGNTIETTRMTIKRSDGNIGIGTDNPTSKLEVYNSSSTPVVKISGPTSGSSALEFYASTTKNGALLVNSSGFLIAADNSNPITFNAGGSERLRIDTSGRLLLGDPSAAINLKYGGSSDFGSKSYVYGANDGFANGLAILNYDATATVPALLKLGSSRNDTIGNNTVVGNTGDKIAAIQFMGNDGTRFIDLARIDAETDGTVGTNDMPGRLMFNVTADGSSVVTERLRITNGGEIASYSSVQDSLVGGSAGGSSTAYSLFTGVHSRTGTQTGGTVAYRIYNNGTTFSISDERHKKNIETARDGYLYDIQHLRVVKYNWKDQDDAEPKELGLIAQEVATVFPGLVQHANLSDPDSELGVKSSVLTFMLIKALQEATTRIEALEAEVAALKGA